MPSARRVSRYQSEPVRRQQHVHPRHGAVGEAAAGGGHRLARRVGAVLPHPVDGAGRSGCRGSPGGRSSGWGRSPARQLLRSPAPNLSASRSLQSGPKPGDYGESASPTMRSPPTAEPGELMNIATPVTDSRPVRSSLGQGPLDRRGDGRGRRRDRLAGARGRLGRLPRRGHPRVAPRPDRPLPQGARHRSRRRRPHGSGHGAGDADHEDPGAPGQPRRRPGLRPRGPVGCAGL